MAHGLRLLLPVLLLLPAALLGGVELSSFTAAVTGAGDVVLSWTTSSEVNNFGFRIQRSADNQTGYQTLPGIFVPGNGTTGVPHDYTATDTSAGPGAWYYRLQQVDLDNEVHYTYGVVAHVGVFGQYRSDPQTLLLLHLDESSGVLANDLSPNRTHGTVTGALPAPGRFAGARTFASSADRIRIADAPSLRPAVLTLEAWVLAPDAGARPYAVIAMKGGTFRLAVNGITRRAVFTLRTSVTDSVEGAALPLEDGRWYHLAGTYDGISLRLYVNGVQQGERPLTGALAHDDGGLFVGADSAGTAGFAGRVDEVRLSSVVRLPSAFNLQLPPVSPGASLISGGVRLSWLNGGGGVGLLRYRIARETAPGTFTVVDSTAALQYDDLAVPPIVSVTYAITAVDSTGFAGAAGTPVTIAVPPAPPALLSPDPGATVDGLSAVLLWSSTARAADRYRLDVAGDSLFTGAVSDSTLTDTTATLVGLTHNARTWWRVAARNGAGWGEPSPARSFRSVYAVNVPLLAGWNMLSLPVDAAEDSVLQVYPQSVYPHAFSFSLTQGYQQERRLRRGTGYWAKLASAHTGRVEGAPVSADSIPLTQGWNLVGSVSTPVDTADVVTVPPGLLQTAFFGYNGSLVPVIVLQPGGAYWVKSAGAGELLLGPSVRAIRKRTAGGK